MAHVRQSITAAVVTTLTGLTTTGARVYAGRRVPLGAEHLPALCVYGRQETADYSRGRMQNTPLRELEVVVEGYAKPATDATLNTIAAEVETALFAGNFSTLAQSVSLGDQELEAENDGEESVGIVRMVFLFEYRTREGAPETGV